MIRITLRFACSWFVGVIFVLTMMLRNYGCRIVRLGGYYELNSSRWK
ncbi:hypothetical protein HY990_04185 [Candidatus Micrarchaeota archaeon]|nr:hypothetical protein [Candidatus Micrarchaeota archaeon]